jgi:ABC-type dipeptide/oligopeptide/nickel transport system ATPase component
MSGVGSTGGILEVEDLGVTFSTETGDVPAVRGVSLHVRPGETLALVGESGSGKSTVALAAMGLLPGTARVSGRASVDGTDVVGAAETALAGLRGRTVSMVFQEPATALDPLTRIGAQIAEVVRNHRPVSAREAAGEAVGLLRRVGIPDPEKRASAYPFQLSGGQRQRVVIAMAIANSPSLLIADEPTTALDVTVQAEILDLLRALAADSGTGVLLVTHNMGVVADFADRVAVMLEGEIVETGPVEEVLLRPTHEYTKRLLAAVPRLAVAGVGGGSVPGPRGGRRPAGRRGGTTGSGTAGGLQAAGGRRGAPGTAVASEAGRRAAPAGLRRTEDRRGAGARRHCARTPPAPTPPPTPPPTPRSSNCVTSPSGSGVGRGPCRPSTASRSPCGPVKPSGSSGSPGPASRRRPGSRSGSWRPPPARCRCSVPISGGPGGAGAGPCSPASAWCCRTRWPRWTRG